MDRLCCAGDRRHLVCVSTWAEGEHGVCAEQNHQGEADERRNPPASLDRARNDPKAARLDRGVHVVGTA
jgi:hypothetical protein